MRAVSAFKWFRPSPTGKVARHKSGPLSGATRAVEKKLYGCFPYASDFIRALGERENSSECTQIAKAVVARDSGELYYTHLSRGVHFHISDALPLLRKKAVYAVRTECIAQDLHGLSAFLGKPSRTQKVQPLRGPPPSRARRLFRAIPGHAHPPCLAMCRSTGRSTRTHLVSRSRTRICCSAQNHRWLMSTPWQTLSFRWP